MRPVVPKAVHLPYRPGHPGPPSPTDANGSSLTLQPQYPRHEVNKNPQYHWTAPLTAFRSGPLQMADGSTSSSQSNQASQPQASKLDEWPVSWLLKADQPPAGAISTSRICSKRLLSSSKSLLPSPSSCKQITDYRLAPSKQWLRCNTPAPSPCTPVLEIIASPNLPTPARVE
jgi:hypothetical protein